MASATAPPAVAFDVYAAQYEAALGSGLRLAGEAPHYFARRRIEWTATVLRDQPPVKRVLDFGCGVGLAVPLLGEVFHPELICGFDPSAAAIERARRELGSGTRQFAANIAEFSGGAFDLAYCNGVFHHVAPADRGAALADVLGALRPGGWLAFWENNPWNPGTRYVMSKIPFDRDAVLISPPAARRLLRGAGFHVARCDAWFLFPRALRWLRPLESLVHRLPLGGQYLVLVQKPG